MASIRKRTPWRIVLDNDIDNAAVFSSLKKATKGAEALVLKGHVTAYVTEPDKKEGPVPATVAVIERAPKVTWQVRIRNKSAPDLIKSFKKKAQAEAWAAEREGEIAKRQFVDYREADKHSLADLLARYARDRLEGRPKDDPDLVRSRMLRAHGLGRIRMSVLQPADIASYRDERVKIVKGSTVKKELELLSRVIAIARAEWNIHLATNPASGKLVKRPEPQDGDERDRRLAEVYLPDAAKPSPQPAPVGCATKPAKAEPKSRRVRVDVDYEDDPEITELLAMPQTEQQALLRACRYPAWFTQRKRDVTAATLKARAKRKTKAPVKARLRHVCRLWAIVSFAIETAMRRGEMLKLLWTHVHLELGYLELPGSITKNRKPRIVPLTLRAMRILATQLRVGDSVFSTNVDAVRSGFRRARRRVGSTDLRQHDLRHEATSRLFEQTDLRATEIGTITGHTDPRMLERYYNKRPGEFVQRFRNSFKSAKSGA